MYVFRCSDSLIYRTNIYFEFYDELQKLIWMDLILDFIMFILVVCHIFDN